ncbi:HpcH/HpaI aldolase/citrate lyase family protein [Thermophagus xiamenensis]|jgi:citrate lyase subunit beta/citryl-CoA lyase|uniref:Citrate lyase subunit beta / citryl-CoA lyase n=1 Tax=Thermophagus xiamenensis TaxID=385682 RepID=A0A1I2E349_9BACT|nr:CoA ester lyase [Thermophagus xiamenensis]SFE87372.1 citrate lyase subunit beta / citryl-CoA lyase [Thermophagus xiamenensis]
MTYSRFNGDFVARTLLFTSGHNAHYVEKAFASDADVIVLDLEDAVPVSQKEEARVSITRVLNSDLIDRRPVFVRINPMETGDTLKDLDTVADPRLYGFVYPKTSNARDMEVFDAQLTLKEKNLGIEKGHFKIIALLETPEAILNAYSIATASKRVVALLFGSEDFLAEIEGEHGPGGRSILMPRHMISMAARAAGVVPIDTPYVNIGDREGLKRHMEEAKELGFEGMLVMSPSEIELVKNYYTPDPIELNRAKEIIELAEETNKANRGISVKKGMFISPPTVSKARKLLARMKKIEVFEDFLNGA